MASKRVHSGSESILNYFSKKAKDMGKTQDEDIVHAYNLIHSVISDIAIFRENIEKDFHDWFMDASRIGKFYDVTLQCPERKDLEGEYVVQFSSPGPFKVWGMDGLLRWEWSLPTVRRIGYQKSTVQLEVEVGRRSCVGEGHFFFACRRASTLYYAIKNTMELIKLQRERSPVPPMMASENVCTADSPGALIDPIIHHTYIKRPITTPNLVSAQTQLLAYTSLVCHDSDQTHTCNVPSAKTIPKSKQTSNQHDDVISSGYTSLAHQDSAQTHIYDVPLGNTTLKQSPDQHDVTASGTPRTQKAQTNTMSRPPKQSPDQHESLHQDQHDVTASGYTSLAHQDSAQTHTYDVPLGNTTLKQSPDQHDVTASGYTSLAHQDSAQTNTFDVRLTNKQSPDQHEDDNTSGYMYISLAHQGGAQTHNYDVPSPTR
ncbi:hypothetical protein EMCRGX_G031007 [Ephydatia muelleri]